MSWLRRLLGRGDGDGTSPDDGRARRVAAKDAPGEGDGRGEFLRLLRGLGARSALIAYDGGHDEGGVTEIRTSREPLPGDPVEWREPRLPGAEEQVEIDWSAFESDPPGLYDAAEQMVASVYSGFAGPFFVKGRLVVDVDGGRTVRHDDLWYDDDDADEETLAARYDEDLQPKVPPDHHEVEPL